MSLFGNIEDNLIILLLSLSDNKDFLRLISIDSQDALSQEPTENFYNLLNKRILLRPKLIEPTNEQLSFLSCWINNNSKVDNNNNYQYDTSVIIDIFCHLSIWQLDDNKIRIYRLVDIVNDSLLNSDIKSIRGKVTLQSNSFTVYNENYMGYRLVYKYTGSLK